MYFEIRIEDINAALGYTIGVVEKRSTLPILGFFLLRAGEDTLEIISTDLEIEIQARTHAAVQTPGACVIPGRKLFDICRSLPKETVLKIRADKDKASLIAGRSRFSLLTFAEQDYPRLNVTGTDNEMEIEVETLRHLIDKTAFAMAQQDVRYYLNGMLFARTPEKMIGVTTDGHRLSKVEIATELAVGAEAEVIVPGKAVQELKRILASLPRDGRIRMAFSEGLLGLSIDDIVFHTKLIDAKYPDYERVIPQNLTKRALIDKEQLRNALMRMNTISYDKYKGVEFIFEDGTLRLVSKNTEQEIAEEDFDITYEGANTSIAFNSSYVVDVLNAVTAEAIELSFVDGDTSAIWRGEGCLEETYVIMPMRL